MLPIHTWMLPIHTCMLPIHSSSRLPSHLFRADVSAPPSASHSQLDHQDGDRCRLHREPAAHVPLRTRRCSVGPRCHRCEQELLKPLKALKLLTPRAPVVGRQPPRAGRGAHECGGRGVCRSPGGARCRPRAHASRQRRHVAPHVHGLAAGDVVAPNCLTHHPNTLPHLIGCG